MKIRGQTVYEPRERILRRITIDKNGCWNWTGTTRNGYGRLCVGSRINNTRRNVSAHRYSYETFVGKIPRGFEVCHHCDNPACVNPEHLFTGTRQDNIDDRESKNRNNHVFGEDVGSSKLTTMQVLEIRGLYKNGLSSRRIADRFNMDHTTVLDIVNRKSWKHVPPPVQS